MTRQRHRVRTPAGVAAAVRSAGAGLVRRAPVRRVLAGTPRARGRGLALLWHRIAPAHGGPDAVVPTVPVQTFRRQLEALATVGDIVPLSRLEEAHDGARPRFAITFDDDHVGHTRYALPILQSLGVPATFFLSGRWTRDLGPYWWEVLEHRARIDGVTGLARRLGLVASGVRDLAAAVEGDDTAKRALERLGTDLAVDVMGRDDARKLHAAGMEVGFHTLHHPVLTRLAQDEVEAAVREGRTALAHDVGAAVERFAYPHGRVDATVEAAVAQAGYVSAWATDHRPVDLAGSPYRHGRWEAGPRGTDALVRGALRRLNLPRSRRRWNG